MLAFELGEDGWLLGFSTGFGQRVRRRRIASRDTAALLEQIEWARGAKKSPEAAEYPALREAILAVERNLAELETGLAIPDDLEPYRRWAAPVGRYSFYWHIR